MDDDVRAKTKLDAIVALVDAKHLPLRLKDSPEAEDQIAFADVVLINKSDLVSPQELADIEATVRKINPSAHIHKTERSNINLSKVLDRGAFDLSRALDNDPHFLDHADDHNHPDHECGPSYDHEDHKLSGNTHDTSVKSISIRAGNLDPNKFFPWIQKTTQMDGPNILRLKGIVAMSCKAFK